MMHLEICVCISAKINNIVLFYFLIKKNSFSNISYLMKISASAIVLVAYLAVTCFSIPFRDQIALVNSLEVGREEDPMVWNCTGCDSSNKQKSSSIIEEPVV